MDLIFAALQLDPVPFSMLQSCVEEGFILISPAEPPFH